LNREARSKPVIGPLRIALLAIVVGVACGSAREERTVNHASGVATTSACSETLKELAAGRVVGFRGLPRGCSRSTVAAAFGPSRFDVDSTGPAGRFREYAGGTGTPNGVLVFFVSGEDEVSFVAIDEFRVDGALASMGPPEAVARSLVSSAAEQRIWASRGLTLHVRTMDETVRRLYAYRPMSAEEFLASSMARAEVRRELRR
jgi:hypothetical protein